MGGGQGRFAVPGPPPTNLNSSACGLDFGSRAVKLVYARGQGGWGRRKLDSIVFYRDYLVRVKGEVRIDWERLGLAPPEALVATGYGKNLLKAHFPTITEIRAHFLGARFVTGLDHFILLEMGGQDTKVLYIREGRVFDFLTNDRCAAGTGRYLENMARFLKMPLTEFAGCWQDPVDISQTCAIFGETELVGHLLEGVEPARIAAGVNASVARRALAMVRRYRCPTLVFVGGVAKNRAVVKLLGGPGGFSGQGAALSPIQRRPGLRARGGPGPGPGKAMNRLAAADPLARALRRLVGAEAGFRPPAGEVCVEPLPSSRQVLRFTFPEGDYAVVGKFFSAYPPQASADLSLAREYDHYLQLPALGLGNGGGLVPRLLGRWPGAVPGAAPGSRARPGPGSSLAPGLRPRRPGAPLPGPGKTGALAGLFSLPAGPGSAGLARARPGLPGQGDGPVAGGRAVDPGGLAGPGARARRLGGSACQDFSDRQVLIHGDATPTNFLFPNGRAVALDLERLRVGDRLWDLSWVAGELKHAWGWRTADFSGSEGGHPAFFPDVSGGHGP